jgi:hypothetical protein
VDFSFAGFTVDIRFILYLFSIYVRADFPVRGCFFSVEESFLKKALGVFPSARWSMN